MNAQYKRLRPFDLELAKKGAAVCSEYDPEPSTDFHRFPNGDVSIYWPSIGVVSYDPDEFDCLFMAPLCWVEGKAVYKDDILTTQSGQRIVVGWASIHGSVGGYTHQCPSMMVEVNPKNLTWKLQNKTVEKVGWVNVYGQGEVGLIHNDKQSALAYVDQCRKLIDTVEISWTHTGSDNE